ncbi:MAG: zinc ribbon domain-containing protein [Pirellulaceae bacterium]|nr:zinc ribbon domain-containing protein [Planctomycetales bacterium]
MPLYEYRCQDCQRECELLIRGSEQPVCPSCQSKRLEKQLSVPAAPSMSERSLPIASEGGGCGKPQCASGCMFGGH